MYIDLLAEWTARYEVRIWAYCLMPNHVHFIAVPKTAESLRLAVGETHERYTRYVNFREGWRGHLWQGRFASYAMDERHLLSAARYIELNPVAAGMVQKPEDYPWSSARAHLFSAPNKLIKDPYLLSIMSDWNEFLTQPLQKEHNKIIEKHERTGRPLGSPGFISEIEALTGRSLAKGKPGPKPASN